MAPKSCINDVNILEHAINKLCTHEFFSTAERNIIERDWSGYLNYKETNTSAILGWLLDPKQGHGLGDFFLKKLLLAAHRAIPTDNEKSNSWEPYQIASWSMSQAIIQTEFVINVLGSKKRIDIIVIDPLSEQTIIIERKMGAKETGNQLSDYFNWVETNIKSRLNHKVTYIISGYWSDTRSQEQLGEWLPLLDDWICDALDEVISKKMAPEKVISGLKQLRYQVFGDWDENVDDFYQGLEIQTSALRNALDNEIRIIEKATFSKPIGDIYQKNIQIMSKSRSSLINAFLEAENDQDYWIINFLISHYDAIHTILTYDHLYWARNRISNLTPEYEEHNNGKILCFTLPYIPREDENVKGYWAAYLILGKPSEMIFSNTDKKNKNEEAKDNLEYRINFHVRKINTPDEWVNRASEIIAQSLQPSFRLTGSRKEYDIPTHFHGHLDQTNQDWLKSAFDWFDTQWQKASLAARKQP